MGYPSNQKGYKLYDLNTHQTFLSRDVLFFEHIFPFQGHPLILPKIINQILLPSLNHLMQIYILMQHHPLDIPPQV